MKITKVETIVINTPMIITSKILPKASGQTRTSIDTLLVRIDTDEGISGWGEGFGHRIYNATKAVIDTFLGQMCIGKDPTAHAQLVEDLQRNLSGVGRNGPAMYALSAIDIALWDIAGKVAGLPIYRLLGGSTRKELPGYASLLRYADAKTVAMYAERALKRGYKHMKLHEITEAPVKAARKVAGDDISIMIDCNCPWTVSQAITMAQTLAPYKPLWIEEPVWPPEDHRGLAKVQDMGGINTAAGENGMLADFRSLFENDAVTYAQPSVTKVGGITMMRKVMTLAESYGVNVVPHSAYFGPGLIASMHCIAAMTQNSLVERFDCDFAETPLHDWIEPKKNGCFELPQEPGLGVNLDLKLIKKLRVA
ncbi:MAG: mandelate racemase/muconate lactonizing enzyme family protein [Betaproteobacteria bacterium]|jgi:L-alanine-DL-glutamate epimerase-like enolase superfamily enzyme